MQRPVNLIFYCTEQEEQTNILTRDGQYGRVGRPSRGENRRPCPSIHAQPCPMERLVNTRHWGAKLTQVPSKNCLFSKFEVWIFICKYSSVADSLIKLLFSCCIALPRPAYLCFYPAQPRRSCQEKKVLPRPVHPCNVRPTCHESLMFRVGRWIALGKTFLRKKMFSFGHCLARMFALFLQLYFWSNSA